MGLVGDVGVMSGESFGQIGWGTAELQATNCGKLVTKCDLRLSFVWRPGSLLEFKSQCVQFFWFLAAAVQPSPAKFVSFCSLNRSSFTTQNFNPFGPQEAEELAAAWGNLHHFWLLRTKFSTLRPRNINRSGQFQRYAFLTMPKFRRDRSTLLRLVRIVTYRRTDGAADLPAILPAWKSAPPMGGRPPSSPGWHSPLEWKPPNPPETLYHIYSVCTILSPREWPFLQPQSPRFTRGPIILPYAAAELQFLWYYYARFCMGTFSPHAEPGAMIRPFSWISWPWGLREQTYSNKKWFLGYFTYHKL